MLADVETAHCLAAWAKLLIICSVQSWGTGQCCCVAALACINSSVTATQAVQILPSEPLYQSGMFGCLCEQLLNGLNLAAPLTVVHCCVH
jgi:hypothetical protein